MISKAGLNRGLTTGRPKNRNKRRKTKITQELNMILQGKIKRWKRWWRHRRWVNKNEINTNNGLDRISYFMLILAFNFWAKILDHKSLTYFLKSKPFFDYIIFFNFWTTILDHKSLTYFLKSKPLFDFIIFK